MKKLIGLIFALILFGILANIKIILEPIVVTSVINSFPDYFSTDRSRTLRNVEALWEITFFIFAFIFSRKLYLFISKNNNYHISSSNKEEAE